MASQEDLALKELLTGFLSLLQSGQYSDLAICSTDRKYAVHKTIVCTQSTFFKTACASSFKESKSNVIELPDDDPDAVDCMIRYFYTLTYPEKPIEPIEDSKAFPKPTTSIDHISSEQIANDVAGVARDLDEVTPNVVDVDADADADAEIAVDSAVLHEDENRGVAVQDSPQTQAGSNADPLAMTCDISLSHLDQDLQVYVLGEKYGIPDLKKKAAKHFEKVLENAEVTVEIFSVVRGVYLMTRRQDRVLRDIVTAKLYAEIQHWIQDEEFMETLRGEADFGVDLLSYTVKENLKQHEATLATIQHPGYCSSCQATLVLKRWLSKRRNVTVKKYCARCEPWQ